MGRVIAVKLAADGFDVAVTCAINVAVGPASQSDAATARSVSLIMTC